MTNIEIKNALENINHVYWSYKIIPDLDKALDSLKRLNAITVIEKAIKILQEKRVSLDKVEKLQKRIENLEKLKAWILERFEASKVEQNINKYKYDTTSDCLKLLKSFDMQRIDQNHFGLELYYYEAGWESERNKMIQDILGWDIEKDKNDDDFLNEEQKYKWKQIENDLPNVLKKIINNN